MHANLNTTLFYDLVLLIECSYWIISPSFPCARQFDIINNAFGNEKEELRTSIIDTQSVINNKDLV